jgi:hypothetical protein
MRVSGSGRRLCRSHRDYEPSTCTKLCLHRTCRSRRFNSSVALNGDGSSGIQEGFHGQIVLAGHRWWRRGSGAAAHSGGNLHESAKQSAHSSFGLKVQGLGFRRSSSKQTLRRAPAPPSHCGNDASLPKPSPAPQRLRLALLHRLHNAHPQAPVEATSFKLLQNGGNPECVRKQGAREAFGH